MALNPLTKRREQKQREEQAEKIRLAKAKMHEKEVDAITRLLSEGRTSRRRQGCNWTRQRLEARRLELEYERIEDE